MAKIKKIKLINFYNYFGEVEYNFHSGMNIVVADNNGGKSKLYNAFLLIIANKIVDSDNSQSIELESKKSKFKVISDNAKRQALKDKEVITGVELIFTTHSEIYTIKKFFKSKKINDDSPYTITNWNISDLQTEIVKQNNNDFSTIPVDAKNQEKILDLLLPYELRHYCMFQGEDVINLVTSGLTKAINKLTDLYKFNYLERFFSDIATKSIKHLNNEERNLSKNRSKSDSLMNEIANIQAGINKTQKKLNEKEDDLINTNNDIEQLSLSIFEASKQGEIHEKIGENKVNLEENINRLNAFEENYNSNFFKSKWILKGLSRYKEKFDQLRSNYELRLSDEKLKEFKTLLPLDSPDISSLEKMIREEKCFVCGRTAKKGTPEFHYIESLKLSHESNKKSNEHSPAKVFCDNLYRVLDNFPKNQVIDYSIYEHNEMLKEFRTKSEFLTREKSDLLNRLNSSEEDNTKIINDYTYKSELKSSLTIDIENLKNDLMAYESTLKKKECELARLAGDNSALVPLKNKVGILEDLKSIFSITRKRFYKEEARKFEKSINSYYESLTKGNQTNPGIVRIDLDHRFNFVSELINGDGGVLSGQGAAFQRMKQLAIVMGLMDESGRNTSFPLIADAPISEMSEILTQNFFYNVPNVFNQSIIFIKDFYMEGSKLNRLGHHIIHESALNIRAFMNKSEGRQQHERVTKVSIISNGVNYE